MSCVIVCIVSNGMNGKAAVGCLVLIDLFCYDWAFGFLMLLVDPEKIMVAAVV